MVGRFRSIARRGPVAERSKHQGRCLSFTSDTRRIHGQFLDLKTLSNPEGIVLRRLLCRYLVYPTQTRQAISSQHEQSASHVTEACPQSHINVHGRNLHPHHESG